MTVEPGVAQGREVPILGRGVLVVVAVTLVFNVVLPLSWFADARPEAEYTGAVSLIIFVALAPGAAMLALALLSRRRARVGALRVLLTRAAALWGGNVALMTRGPRLAGITQ